MKTRTVFLLLSLLIAPALTAVAGELPGYIAGAPGASEYPHDDGLILRQVVRVTLRADGRVERHEETSLKMLTAYLTRHDYFDPHIHWNDARATMRVDQARTYMVDGTVVDAKANSLVPNTGEAFQWAVPYAHMRELTVAHVGVEHGATSVLAYTVTDRQPVGQPLWGVVELQSFLPIVDQWVTVEVPAGTPVALAGIGADVAADRSSKDGLDVYTVHRTDVPPLNASEAGWDASRLQRLAYSTSASWDDTRRALAEGVEASVRLDGALSAKARTIVDGSTLPDEQIARLHRFVVDGVRTIDWPVDRFDYATRPADAVLDSSVGHALDKAVLLVSLLRTQGLDAAVALAAGTDAVAHDVPAPAQLDQVWVRVRVGKKEHWISPTSGGADKWDLAGHAVLVLDGTDGALLERPRLDASANNGSLRLSVDAGVDDDAITLAGTADVDLAFGYNPFVHYERGTDRHTGLAAGIAGALGGASVDDVFVGRQGCSLSSFRAAFSGGRVEVPESGLVRLELPAMPGGLRGADLGLERAAATAPQRIAGAPASERIDVELTLPPGFEVAFVPADEAVANELGSARRTVSVEDGTLTVRTVLVLDTDVVAPADHGALRALFDVLEGDSDRTILLRRAD